MKPILFNTEMVRAILDGRKTVTRRVVKPQPKYATMVAAGLMVSDNPINVDMGLIVTKNGDVTIWDKLPYRPGDILYVRETWTQDGDVFRYKAGFYDQNRRWHPSIHMPREAARIFLRVTGVRVERLQDITSEQIDAEGCKEWAYSAKTGELLPSGPSWFRIAWDSTIKKADRARYGWEANPWVWVIEFERCEKPEGEIL